MYQLVGWGIKVKMHNWSGFCILTGFTLDLMVVCISCRRRVLVPVSKPPLQPWQSVAVWQPGMQTGSFPCLGAELQAAFEAKGNKKSLKLSNFTNVVVFSPFCHIRSQSFGPPNDYMLVVFELNARHLVGIPMFAAWLQLCVAKGLRVGAKLHWWHLTISDKWKND